MNPNFDIPRGRVPYDLVSNSFIDNLALAGDLLWIVTWVLVIYVGFKQKTYAVPLIAICLNFTWEFVFTLVYPPRKPSGEIDPIDFVIQLIWLLLSCVIVYQLLRWGREFQPRPEFKRHFFRIVLVLLASALCLHLSFGLSVDNQGLVAALIINLAMSLLFIEFFYQRDPDKIGISFWVALTKMLGTFLIGLAAFLRFWPDHWAAVAFVLVMFGAIALFDVIYIVLVYRHRHEAAV